MTEPNLIVVSQDSPTPKATRRPKTQSTKERLAQLEARLRQAQEAEKAAYLRMCAIVGRVVVEQWDDNQALRALVAPLLQQHITGKTDRREVAALIALERS